MTNSPIYDTIATALSIMLDQRELDAAASSIAEQLLEAHGDDECAAFIDALEKQRDDRLTPTIAALRDQLL